jgi:hypothetical protein
MKPTQSTKLKQVCGQIQKRGIKTATTRKEIKKTASAAQLKKETSLPKSTKKDLAKNEYHVMSNPCLRKFTDNLFQRQDL